MSILDELKNQEVWNSFLHDRIEKDRLSKAEVRELESFITEKRYEQITESYDFALPEKKIIAKRSSGKKRTVYTFSKDETWILKALAFLLHRYDASIPDSCYSFRRNRNAKTAVAQIRLIPGRDRKYALKADIHDYFNSIDVTLLLEQLKEVISDDEPLFIFLEELMTKDQCICQGEIIHEQRGAMAGIPLASFFANLYLKDLDHLFEEKHTPYFRYSDDILIFFDTEEELKEGYALLLEYLQKMKLQINREKTKTILPSEPIEFLGFQLTDDEIDLSAAAVSKMKGKIRRKAKKLYRWRKKNNADYDRAASAMIRSFDRIFYDLSGTGEFTWTRYYFPVITADKGLKEIDAYMLEYLRYLYTGKHTKKNYRITYEHLKQLGYTPLTAEYYRWKKESRAFLPG